MKESTRLERDRRDIGINHKCHDVCHYCEKYKTMREADKKCEVIKARERLIDRKIRDAKKKGITQFDL